MNEQFSDDRGAMGAATPGPSEWPGSSQEPLTATLQKAVNQAHKGRLDDIIAGIQERNTKLQELANRLGLLTDRVVGPIPETENVKQPVEVPSSQIDWVADLVKDQDDIIRALSRDIERLEQL